MLRLHHGPDDDGEERIIPFPTAPKPPVRLVTDEEEAIEPISVQSDLAKQIESTLDRMQESLDEFCEQLDSLPFPELADDDGPDRAA